MPISKIDFERSLDEVCEGLTALLSSASPPRSSTEFERVVREELHTTLQPYGLEVELDPKVQQFPDIPLAPFGVEVKFTTNDTWRSIANSVSEGTRIDEIEQIYVIFGKRGGVPEARWRTYDDCVIHVRTSHRPRFEVDMTAEESLFDKIGVSYSEFRKLSGEQRMEHVRNYARARLKPGEQLWWLDAATLESGDAEPTHTLPIQARLFKSLTKQEQRQLRAEMALLFPSIFRSSRSRDKYDGAALYLLTYHGVVAPQLRDNFTAGSVAGPARGGRYLQRSLQDIELEIREAAERLEDSLFEEYWGYNVPKNQRIQEWLRLADKEAGDWVPSKELFSVI